MFDLNRIKKILESKGLNTQDLADKLGISNQAVYKIYQSNSTSLRKLEEICHALNISPNQLFESETTSSLEPQEKTTGPFAPQTNKLNNNTKKGGEMIPDKTITALTEELEFLREMIRDEKHEKRELMDLIRGLNGGAEALRKEA